MTARPRAFEPHRLSRAVRGNVRVLAAVVLLALFAGAALARVAIPNRMFARSALHIVGEPHRLVAAARSDELLAEALRRAGQVGSAEALRRRLELDFHAPGQLRLELDARPDESGSLNLAKVLTELYVERANRDLDARVAASDVARRAMLASAQSERERARVALQEALAREGAPELPHALAIAQAHLAELESAASEATTQLAVRQDALRGLENLGRAPIRSQAPAELAATQRSLSALLAEYGQEHPQVEVARRRLERLQGETAEVANSALKQRLEASTLAAKARVLNQQVEQQRAELSRLLRISERVAPLSARDEQVRARLHELEALTNSVPIERSSVQKPASLHVVNRRTERMLASLVTGAVAALALLAFFVFGAVRNFRVCAPTELAYWLGVPVLASSAWPRRAEALESLVDELADPAIAARGVVLVLPVTEAERPLAATLSVQLNARAQRQFRSTTGSRVTIAQPWLGELGSSRIKRAAEAADRVLWVVAADAHRGRALRHCRDLVGRQEGVAALLVDADPHLPTRVGNTRAFWTSRAPAQVVSTDAQVISR